MKLSLFLTTFSALVGMLTVSALAEGSESEDGGRRSRGSDVGHYYGGRDDYYNGGEYGHDYYPHRRSHRHHGHHRHHHKHHGRYYRYRRGDEDSKDFGLAAANNANMDNQAFKQDLKNNAAIGVNAINQENEDNSHRHHRHHRHHHHRRSHDYYGYYDGGYDGYYERPRYDYYGGGGRYSGYRRNRYY